MSIYPWKRIWTVPGIESEKDYEGFPFYRLDNSRFFAKNAFTLEELEVHNCLILLGKPGSGKSTIVKEVGLFNSNDLISVCSLNIYSTSAEIINSIENDATFKQWKESNYQNKFFLFLDSFDEGLLHVRVLYASLRVWLEKLKLKVGEQFTSFKLRITCRTAVWDNSFTEELKAIFNSKETHENRVFLYELALLTQTQLREAARVKGLNEDEFIERVVSLQLQAMASTPITLQFLIQSFQAGKLNRADILKSDVYLEGCEKLCTENNPERRRSTTTILLNPRKRILIAARIAAYTTFSNKGGINKEWHDDIPEGLSPSSFIIDSFEIAGENISIDDNTFKEVLEGTSLFSSTINGLLGWSHKTYEEFLCAWHLKLLDLPIVQIQQLFFSTEYTPYQLIPQLEEVALWLCSLNEKFLELVIQLQPKLILQIEDRLLDHHKRSIVLSALLSQVANQQESESWYDESLYTKLNHPTLDQQLRPYIEDKNKNFVVRRMAMRITEACKVNGLEEALWNVLEDKTELITLRTHAADALAISTDTDWLVKMIPFGLEPQAEDESDELKGTILNIIYPKVISIQEIFKSLTDFKRDGLLGLYKGFVYRLGDKIPEEDLEKTIDSFLSNDLILRSISNHDHDFEKLTDSLISRLWIYANDNNIARALAKLIVELLSGHSKIIITDDDDLRRKVALEVIKLMDQTNVLWLLYNYNKNKVLISYSDWDWLISIIQTETDTLFRSKVAQILRRIFPLHNLSLQKVETILILSEQFTELKAQFIDLLDSVDLDSSEAKESVEYYRIMQEHNSYRSDAEREDRGFNPETELLNILHNSNPDDIDKWYSIIYLVCLSKNEEGRFYNTYYEVDTAKWFIWNSLDSESKQQVLQQAYSSFEIIRLKNYSVADFRNGAIKNATGYDYKTLHLVLDQKPSFIESFDIDFYQRWGAMILWGYLDKYGEPSDTDKKLFQNYYKFYDSFISNLALLVEQMANQSLLSYEEIEKLTPFFDENIGQILIAVFENNNIKHAIRHSILDYLMNTNFQFICEYVFQRLTLLSESANDEDQSNLLCGAVSILYVELIGWEEVSKLLNQNSELGKKLFLIAADYISYRDRDNLFSRKLTIKQLGQLLIWLYKNFPTNEDPRHDGSYSPSARDNIVDIRNGCLNHLIRYGSLESLSILSAVIQALPEEEFLPWRLIEAKKNMRKNTWIPESPTALKTLLQNKEKRIVNNGNDLLEIIILLDKLSKG